jgi:hypothetical protein
MSDVNVSVRLLSLRRIPETKSAHPVDIHSTETYLRDLDETQRIMPPQPEACRGCYYLG